MLPSSRDKDVHLCPIHGAGCTEAQATGVEVNSLRAARGADPAPCPAVVDFIVTGAKTVKIKGKPAARFSSKMMHGGMVILGSGNVYIGGPDAGVTLGNPEAGVKACEAAAAGRKSGKCKQSYQNCGLEAARILANQQNGTNHTEDEILDHALDNWESGGSGGPNSRDQAGGSTPWERERLLRDYGVESSTEPQDMSVIEQSVADGKGVITSHDGGTLWEDTKKAGVNHSVNVTGITYGPDGKIESVTVLDTGAGECSDAIPIDRFKKSLRGWPSKANITKGRVWPS